MKASPGLLLIGFVFTSTVGVFQLNGPGFAVSSLAEGQASFWNVAIASCGLWFLTLSLVGAAINRLRPVGVRARAR